MKPLMFLCAVLACFTAQAQECNCNKELEYIQQFMEHNYVGFKDKVNPHTRASYLKTKADLLKLSKSPVATKECLLLVSKYLDWFGDNHIQVRAAFDALKTDTGFALRSPVTPISSSRLATLSSLKGIEGIYISQFDSSYRIAVIKETGKTYDYKGVMLQSKLSHWKPGMVKFLAYKVNDSLYKGVLFMRNHMPKVDWFFIGKNTIGGDWLREGTVAEKTSYNYEPVASRLLNNQTLYMKIANFSPSNAKNIDSMVKSREAELKTLPYLVLDLRNNGGGSDFAYSPLIPYLYTSPVKNIGVDVYSTDATIAGWKLILEDKDIPETSKESIRTMISKMEAGKGTLVNIVDDTIDSTYERLANPKKIVILVDKGCASTTEQFLLFARQSSKVIIAGENTQGTLDYSNMREASFSCMPYKLEFATTRSRRLDAGQGIDNIGIKPQIYFQGGTDWIDESLKLLKKD
jgi:hypothetical protein